jgi:hypothetical protein
MGPCVQRQLWSQDHGCLVLHMFDWAEGSLICNSMIDKYVLVAVGIVMQGSIEHHTYRCPCGPLTVLGSPCPDAGKLSAQPQAKFT